MKWGIIILSTILSVWLPWALILYGGTMLSLRSIIVIGLMLAASGSINAILLLRTANKQEATQRDAEVTQRELKNKVGYNESVNNGTETRQL